MLSYLRKTALQGALLFSPKVEDFNGELIFYGHYRSIFNHCDIIGLKICRLRWKKTQKGLLPRAYFHFRSKIWRRHRVPRPHFLYDAEILVIRL